MAINIEGSVRDLLRERLALRLSAKLMSGIVRVYAMKENQLEKIAQDASNEIRKRITSVSSTTLPKGRQVFDAFAKLNWHYLLYFSSCCMHRTNRLTAQPIRWCATDRGARQDHHVRDGCAASRELAARRSGGPGEHRSGRAEGDESSRTFPSRKCRKSHQSTAYHVRTTWPGFQYRRQHRCAWRYCQRCGRSHRRSCGHLQTSHAKCHKQTRVP